MKYYFISYQWTRNTINGWEVANTVTNMHPMEWLKECIDNGDDCRITFFSEISEEHYETLDGEL